MNASACITKTETTGPFPTDNNILCGTTVCIAAANNDPTTKKRAISKKSSPARLKDRVSRCSNNATPDKGSLAEWAGGEWLWALQQASWWARKTTGRKSSSGRARPKSRATTTAIRKLNKTRPTKIDPHPNAL